MNPLEWLREWCRRNPVRCAELNVVEGHAHVVLRYGDQDGCSAHVLDELAAAVNAFCATLPPGVLVRAATDAEQREALDRVLPPGFLQVSKADLVDLPDFHLQRAHIEVVVDGTSRGSVLVTNRSTIELEVMQADGTSIGLPPTARGMVHTGSSIRTPPREHDELTLGVTERELRWAQRQAFERVHTGQGADYLWITRLQDGRGLFLTGWSMGGVQLSIGRFGDLEWNDGWCYHPGHSDEGWRAALAWDGRGEPKGWTRHPRTGRVRPDGTPSSEAVER